MSATTFGQVSLALYGAETDGAGVFLVGTLKIEVVLIVKVGRFFIACCYSHDSTHRFVGMGRR